MTVLSLKLTMQEVQNILGSRQPASANANTFCQHQTKLCSIVHKAFTCKILFSIQILTALPPFSSLLRLPWWSLGWSCRYEGNSRAEQWRSEWTRPELQGYVHVGSKVKKLFSHQHDQKQTNTTWHGGGKSCWVHWLTRVLFLSLSVCVQNISKILVWI